MPLTAAQANAQLANITTQAELRSLLGQLDIHAEGKVTIFYGNGIDFDGKRTKAGDIVTSMVNQGEDIRVIDKTELKGPGSD